MSKNKWIEKKFLGFPVYGIITGIILLLLMQNVYYNLGGWFARLPDQTINILKIPFLDDAIPMVRIFILPYILSFAFWFVGLIAPSRADKEFYFDWVVGSLIALTLGCLIFFLYPTYMYRDQENLYQLAGTGILGKLITFIYNADGENLAVCLFPSYHCLTSALCFLGVWGRKELAKGFRIYTLIFTVLIYLSTVFVKQHYLPDVISGILLAVIGVKISTKFHLGRGLVRRIQV